MTIKENELEKVSQHIMKQNEMILDLYKKSNDKSLLKMLYITSHDIYQIVEEFGISIEDAEELVRFDIENEQKVEESENSEESQAEEETVEEDEDCDDSFFDDVLLSDIPEKIIDAVCFIGDVIQESSEKICDVLDEAVERVWEHDFD